MPKLSIASPFESPVAQMTNSFLSPKVGGVQLATKGSFARMKQMQSSSKIRIAPLLGVKEKLSTAELEQAGALVPKNVMSRQIAHKLAGKTIMGQFDGKLGSRANSVSHQASADVHQLDAARVITAIDRLIN